MSISRNCWILLCLWSLLFLTAGPAAASLFADLRQRLDDDRAGSLALQGLPAAAGSEVRRFYRERGFRPAWSGGAGEPMLEELMAAISTASRQGLVREDYHYTDLQRTIAAGDRVAVELFATHAYLRLAGDLADGRLKPAEFQSAWSVERPARDWGQHLQEALARASVADSLKQLEPRDFVYQLLVDELDKYRKAAEEGGWGRIPAGPVLEFGANGPRVTALRRRLQAAGLLPVTDPSSDLFDEETTAGVTEFQRRTGVAADGVVGPATLRELNKSAEARVGQILANLERWRWLPDDLGARYIRVNIPDFRLEAFADGRLERSHKVIVGRTDRQTPVFSAAITYVVLNPWWEAPERLARIDRLPEFQEDPARVSRLGFEILDLQGDRLDSDSIDWQEYSADNFPFRLRQRPGPQNAMGQVKLMLPNRHEVILHDTPAKKLFSRPVRTFSSGCVRVSDALDLAEWVLRDTPGWSRDEIDTVLASGRETRVDLVGSLPVYFLYLTAAARPDGGLTLLDDVYRRDRTLIAALRR